MSKLWMVSALVFAVGCKGGMDAKLDDLGKIRDAMCACKDKTCADTQHEAYIAWKKGNSKDEKPSGDQMERFEKIRKELQDCRHKVEGGAGGEAPAAPAAAPGSAAPTP